MEKVEINKVNGGYVVKVGCQVFVFTCSEKMFEALNLYWKDPKKAEKKYVDEIHAEEMRALGQLHLRNDEEEEYIREEMED